MEIYAMNACDQQWTLHNSMPPWMPRTISCTRRNRLKCNIILQNRVYSLAINMTAPFGMQNRVSSCGHKNFRAFGDVTGEKRSIGSCKVVGSVCYLKSLMFARDFVATVCV